MARHRVGSFSVEVLHQQDGQTGRIAVSVYVFRGRQFVEMARFGWREFNSAELGRRLPSLANIPVRRLDAVIEDARCWPKTIALTPPARPSTTKRRRRGSRKTGP